MCFQWLLAFMPTVIGKYSSISTPYKIHKHNTMRHLISLAFVVATINSAFAQSYVSHFSLEGRLSDPYVNSYIKQTNGNMLVAAIVNDSVLCKPSNIITYAESVVKNPGTSLTSFDASGNPIWTKNWFPITYLNSFFYANHVVEDAAQNIYISGRFSGLVDMDPGTSVDTFRTALNSGAAFIVKLDANGNYLWHRIFSGAVGTYHIFWDLVVVPQANGSLQCHGNFSNTIDMDPGTGVANFSSSSFSSQTPIFINLDANGNYVNAVAAGATGTASISELKADTSASNLALYLVSDTLDVDLQSTTVQYTNAAEFSTHVLARYNSSNQLQWSKALDTSVSVLRTHVLPNGDFYLMGSLDTSGVLGTGSVHTVGVGNALFLEKWTAAGNCLWSKAYNCKGNLWPSSITYKQGALVALYSFSDSINFAAGFPVNAYASNYDFAMSIFDSLGNHVSTSKIASDSSSVTYESTPIFSSNSVTFKSYVYGNADLNPTPSTTAFTPHYVSNNPCVFVTWTYNPPLALEQSTNIFKLVIAPNPASEELQVYGLQQPAQVSIVDLYGRQIAMHTLNNTSDKIDIKNLPVGNYLLRSGNAVVRFAKR
jgi:hypothetical protein